MAKIKRRRRRATRHRTTRRRSARRRTTRRRSRTTRHRTTRRRSRARRTTRRRSTRRRTNRRRRRTTRRRSTRRRSTRRRRRTTRRRSTRRQTNRRKSIQRESKLKVIKNTEMSVHQTKTLPKKRYSIKDPPFSKKESKGTEASALSIDYHYQHYSNIMEYLEILCKGNKKLKSQICFFPHDSVNAFLRLELNNLKKGVHSKYIPDTHFTKIIHKCLQKEGVRYLPLMLETVKKKTNHANLLFIDKRKKRIEVFEPHGPRNTKSSLGGVAYAYGKKMKALQRYFKKHLSDYDVVNVVDSVQGTSLQSMYDRGSGYCVTWSLLYSHYRLINQKVPYTSIVQYMDRAINTRKLLQYAHHVERKLKIKI